MQQPGAISYGATGHVANNPFAMAAASAPMVEQDAPPSYGEVANTYGYTQGQQPQAGQMPSYDPQSYQQQQQQQ